MEKGKFFFVIILCGILGVVSVSGAQTGPGREMAYDREADNPVVRVHGPDVLTDLAGQAIMEERPHVVVVRNYKSLKNKVWIEGTTGADYMQLSPKRVAHMQAARAKGGSVYAALCAEQRGVIQKTVGIRRVERKEYRTEVRTCYVQSICPPPAPPVVYVPQVEVWYDYYPSYVYGSYGMWGYGGYPYYRGWRGYGSYHPAYRGYYW